MVINVYINVHEAIIQIRTLEQPNYEHRLYELRCCNIKKPTRHFFFYFFDKLWFCTL